MGALFFHPNLYSTHKNLVDPRNSLWDLFLADRSMRLFIALLSFTFALALPGRTFESGKTPTDRETLYDENTTVQLPVRAILPPPSPHNEDIELLSHPNHIYTAQTATRIKSKASNIEDTLTQKKSWMKPASLWNRITEPFSQTSTRSTHTRLATKTAFDKSQSSDDALAPLANPNTNVWGVRNVWRCTYCMQPNWQTHS